MFATDVAIKLGYVKKVRCICIYILGLIPDSGKNLEIWPDTCGNQTFVHIINIIL